MKRITPLVQARSTGALVIDADGINVDLTRVGPVTVPLVNGTGKLEAVRQGRVVFLHFESVSPTAEYVSGQAMAVLPAELRPSTTHQFSINASGTSSTPRRVTVNTSGNIAIFSGPATTDAYMATLVCIG